MPITKRRFEQWRGSKAPAEIKYIDTAVLISDYVQTVSGLDAIKEELSNIESPQLRIIDQYGKRAFGVVVYLILTLEELIEKLPDTASIEKELLIQLKDILAACYDDAYANKEKANKLVPLFHAIINSKLKEHADPQLAKALYFSLYTTFIIVNTILYNPGWIVKMAKNLDQTKADVASLLKVIEVKMLQLTKSSSGHQSSSQKTIQDHFNKRYLAELDGDFSSLWSKSNSLNESASTVIEGLNHLVKVKNSEKVIAKKIKELNGFLQVVRDNDDKTIGRMYFLDLMTANKDSFQLLMSMSSGPKKEQLEANIEELQSPEYQQYQSSSIGWLISFGSAAYRATAPAFVQKAVSNVMPVTLDREAKVLLKDLIQECLDILAKKLNVANQKITKAVHPLAKGDEALKQLLITESVENLHKLVKINVAVKDVLNEYFRICGPLKEKIAFMGRVQQSHSILTQFVAVHDTWWVHFTNYLAEMLPSLFVKSEIAVMIDKVNVMKAKLAEYEAQYKKDVVDGIKNIQENPLLAADLKTRLVDEFDVNQTVAAQVQATSAPDTAEVNAIISQFSNKSSAFQSIFKKQGVIDKSQPSKEIEVILALGFS